MNRKLKSTLLIALILIGIAVVIYLVKKKPTTVIEPDPPEVTDIIPEIEQDSVEEIEVGQAIEDTAKPIDSEPIELDSAKPFPFKSTGYFAPPLKGPLFLSGTFAEMRHNHFHAGLDIRTNGVEGAEVFAAADGYVSRVKVMERGYGKALYIQHPNGTTTVYGHLQKYDGVVLDAVMKQHYMMESYEMDWYPVAKTILVKKGDRVAYSGNTGGSGGAHLHFEIRDGKNADVYNPLLYGLDVPDKIAPSFKGLQFYKIDEDKRVRTGTFDWSNVSIKESNIKLLPGSYGIGVNWSEFFTDYMNQLGVNYARMEVDGVLKFNTKVEHFAFDDGRLVNQHMNFHYFDKTGVRYVKMFKDKGNSLNFYSGNGIIQLTPGKSHEIAIYARDFAGNASRHKFTITCVEDGAIAFESAPEYGGRQYFHNVINHLTSENAKLTIPAYTLYNDFYLNLTEQDGQAGIASKMIRVHETTVPIHKKVTLSIKPLPAYTKWIKKLVMMEYDVNTHSSSSKGTYVNGQYITKEVKNFGLFYLAFDTIPPKVSLTTNGRSIVARASDLTCDIGYYRGTIDGQWILFEYEFKEDKLKAIVPSSIPSGKHSLKLVVRDEVGNETVVTREIVI